MEVWGNLERELCPKLVIKKCMDINTYIITLNDLIIGGII